jgi:hypothetical protein
MASSFMTSSSDKAQTGVQEIFGSITGFYQDLHTSVPISRVVARHGERRRCHGDNLISSDIGAMPKASIE